MISAIIVLTLISLLVATDPEPTSASAHPTPEPPLRPAGKRRELAKETVATDHDQLAA